MSDKNVELIIDQVQMRLHDIQRAYELGDYDMADRQLSELRDVLDDIYDRPEEDIQLKPSAESVEKVSNIRWKLLAADS